MSEPRIHRTIRPLRQPSPRHRQSMTVSREARLHSPWKRSACDRCRSLKLKCGRDNENTTRACVRCTRADATCFTSSAKTPAPAAQARTNANFVSHASSPACINLDMADLRRGRERRSLIRVMQISSESAKNQESAFVMRWPFTYSDEDAATLDIDFDVDVPLPNESRQANYFDSPVEPPFYSDYLSLANPSSAPATSVLPIDSHSELFSGADGVISHLTPGRSIQSDKPSSEISDETSPGILLANLQQSLSKQLAELESKSWDSTVLSITSSPTAGSGGEQALAQEGCFNPIAPILNSTSDFVTILRLLKKPPPSPSVTAKQDSCQDNKGSQSYMGRPSLLSRNTNPSTPVLGSSPANTLPSQKMQSRVHLLTTINCYFLVLSIFDGIFSRLLKDSEKTRPQGSADASSYSPLSSLQNSSSRNPRLQLYLAGHSFALSARLRTQLLAQVVKQQLMILEQELGLPQTSHVSSAHAGDAGNTPAEDGMLGRPESLLLLQAIMGGMAGTDNSGSSHRGEELGRSPVALSLIDKLERAHKED